MPRISVIMGVFNCAETLVEALDSLYAQTYQDFKIIICEDGSTDDTYETAQEYASKHDNIVLLRNDHNMGLNFSLNRCLEISDTEFVARMDGDDISMPDRFKKELTFLERHPEYAFVSCPMVYFDKSGDFLIGRMEQEPGPKELFQGNAFCHAPVMIRNSAYRTVGGYSLSKYLLRVEDQHLWLKLYQHGLKGYNLDEPLYKMRDDRNASKRRTFANRRNEAYVKCLVCASFGFPWWFYIKAVVGPFIKWVMPPIVYKWSRRIYFSHRQV